jgi:hypothetical protein
VYGVLSIESSALVVARTLDRLEEPAFKQAMVRGSALSSFLRSGTGLDDETLSTIMAGAARMAK